MATFTWKPSRSTKLRREPRVWRNLFGDGYVQRVRKGVNHNPQTWQLIFKGQARVFADQIETFIQENAAEGFDWTPPGKTAGRYVCDGGCVRTYSGFDGHTLTMTFTQDFAP